MLPVVYPGVHHRYGFFMTDTPRLQWAVFFEYLTDPGMRGKINEIAGSEEGIAVAGGVLLNISRNEIERARLESEYKAKIDIQARLVDERREGRKEGEGDGLKKAARNALSEGFSLEQVHKITGLDMQTIRTLQGQ